MSWHPNSRSFDTSSGYCPTSEPALRNTIAGLQSLAMTSVDASSGESPVRDRDPVPMGINYAANPPYTITMRPAAGYPVDSLAGIDPPTAYVTHPYHSWPNPFYSYWSDMPPPYDPGVYPALDFQQPGWSDMSDFPTYIPSQAPDFLPSQCPPNRPDASADGGVSHLPRKSSKELVGMGLYDNPDNDAWSEVEYGNGSILCHHANPHRESTGKGLKLEETWEPPKDQDGAEEEEAYSSDEAEEDLLRAPIVGQGQPAFYPRYGDLSNQSFFFDTDDACSGCIAFDQAVPQYQARCSDPARENFLWC